MVRAEGTDWSTVTSILRIRTAWTGVQGAPYLSTHYFTRVDSSSAASAADAVAALWDGLADTMQEAVDWTVEGFAAVIDDTTGALTGLDPISGGNSGSGTASASLNPLVSQGLLRLQTSAVVSGRILRGRTFLPGSVESYNATGAPEAGYISAVNAAFDDLMAVPDAELRIYSRAHNTSAVVVSGSCWDQWAALRSRRD